MINVFHILIVLYELISFYIIVLDGNISNIDDTNIENKYSKETEMVDEEADTLEKFETIKTPLKKRKRTSWQRGLLKKKKRRILNNNHSQVSRLNPHTLSFSKHSQFY